MEKNGKCRGSKSVLGGRKINASRWLGHAREEGLKISVWNCLPPRFLSAGEKWKRTKDSERFVDWKRAFWSVCWILENIFPILMKNILNNKIYRENKFIAEINLLTSKLTVWSPKLHLVAKLFFLSNFFVPPLFVVFTHLHFMFQYILLWCFDICWISGFCFSFRSFQNLAFVEFHVFVRFHWIYLGFRGFQILIYLLKGVCFCHFSFRTFRKLWGRKYISHWEERSLGKSCQKSQKIADPGGDEKRKKLGRFLRIFALPT